MSRPIISSIAANLTGWVAKLNAAFAALTDAPLPLVQASDFSTLTSTFNPKKYKNCLAVVASDHNLYRSNGIAWELFYGQLPHLPDLDGGASFDDCKYKFNTLLHQLKAKKWMVNPVVFLPTNDINCQAWWGFNLGSELLDYTTNNNDLTNINTSTFDLIEAQEGTACLKLIDIGGNTQRLEILDANLSSDFPLKSSVSTPEFAICCLFNSSNIPEGYYSGIISKGDATNDTLSFVIYNECVSSTVSKIRIRFGYGDGVFTSPSFHYEEIVYSSDLDANKWYSIIVNYKDSDKTYRISIYDILNHDYVTTDNTGILTNNLANTVTGILNIGCSVSLWGTRFLGYIDSVAVFNRVLSEAEILEMHTLSFMPEV